MTGIAFAGFVNDPAETLLQEAWSLSVKSLEPPAGVTLHAKAGGPESKIRTIYSLSSLFSVTLC